MNWKTVYPLLLISTSIIFVISIYNSDYVSIYGMLIIGLRAIIYLPVFLFAIELNKTIATLTKSKRLRTYEILSYITLILLILGILGNIFLFTQGAYRYVLYSSSLMVLAVIALIFQIILIASLFMAYKIKKVEAINLTGGNTSEIDILDDFGFEDEEDFNLQSNRDSSAQFSTISERLKVCQVCTKKSFNIKVGVVCSLTDKKPEFVEFCELYEEDAKAKVLHEKTAMPPAEDEAISNGSWKGALLMSFLGFVRAALKGFDDPFGIIFLVLGIVWLVIALATSGNKR